MHHKYSGMFGQRNGCVPQGFGAGYLDYLFDLLTHVEPEENFLADGAINKKWVSDILLDPNS